MKMIIASSNKGKIEEFKKILGDYYEILSLSDVGFIDEIEETGTTFEENSYIKAKAVFDKTGIATLADDSGLVVPSLNGEPGVLSARYAGDHDMEKNKKKLLEKIEGKDRYAYFVCALTLLDEKGKICVSGKTEGEILREESGNGGFGYDPLFFSYDLKKSFALCSENEKNSVSHRGRAVKELLKVIKEKRKKG